MSGHNTDYGTLPADLFEPDSSDSAPVTSASAISATPASGGEESERVRE